MHSFTSHKHESLDCNVISIILMFFPLSIETHGYTIKLSFLFMSFSLFFVTFTQTSIQNHITFPTFFFAINIDVFKFHIDDPSNSNFFLDHFIAYKVILSYSLLSINSQNLSCARSLI